MKKILSLILILLISQTDIYTQDVLHNVKHVNVRAIQTSAICRTKIKMKLKSKKHLSAFTYFGIVFENKFENERCSTSDLFNNVKKVFCRNPVTFVYDDSLNLLSIVDKQNVIVDYKPELSKEYMYIRYLNKFQPEYIFSIYGTTVRSYLFLCYKNNSIYVAYLSDNKEKIITYPLSEFDCRLLYSGDEDIFKEWEDLPVFPQE